MSLLDSLGRALNLLIEKGGQQTVDLVFLGATGIALTGVFIFFLVGVIYKWDRIRVRWWGWKTRQDNPVEFYANGAIYLFGVGMFLSMVWFTFINELQKVK